MERIIGRFDALAAAVRRATRKKAEGRKEAARLRAQRIKDEARERADRVHDEILAEARQQAEARRRQLLAEATQDARRKHLTAREEIMDRAWDEAEQALRQLVESDDYPDVLRQLTWQALEALGPGHLVLAADPTGHDLLTGDRLSAWAEAATDNFDALVELERASEPLDTWGGLIATTGQGRRRVDARFPQRLETARGEIREDVFDALMGES